MNIFDPYTDYLQITPGLATATGLSSILDKAVFHDQVTRMLSNYEFNSKSLWHFVKPLVRQHEHIDGCLIFDDTILHKPHIDENEIICWHHDHATGKSVKGINLLTTFYYSQKVEQAFKLPVAFDIIAKYGYCDIKSKKEIRKNLYTKNMKFIHQRKKYFILTQCTHIFAAILSYTKQERYKFSTKLNHFALKSTLFLNVAKAAFKELELIKQQHAKCEISCITK